MPKPTSKPVVLLGIVCVVAGLSVLWISRPHQATSLTSVNLGDGRILQIEGVTYGTNNRIGSARSRWISPLYPWLPNKVMQWLEPKIPQSTIDGLSRPSLVVWVNAIDAVTRSNVDCQGIRVELVGKDGDLFESDPHWTSFANQFIRVGHVFESYPRTETNLTLKVTTWKAQQTSRMEFSNPFIARPEAWTGQALPQEKAVADLTISLTQLMARTNGYPKPKYWETPSVYWEPVWDLRQGTSIARGWDAPEWFAEDSTGNHAQRLGVHQPVLRFSAAFYPSPTNGDAVQILATLPAIVVTNLHAISWWNQKITLGNMEIEALGFFPAGSYVFSDGMFVTNHSGMGAVGGGAPTGWTGQSMQTNPLKVKYYHGHYSVTNSIIYVHATTLGPLNRLAIRLRDERGALWLTQPEPQGSSDGIYPFLINLPPEVQHVIPELVLLKPATAQFTVKVPTVPAPSTNSIP